VPGDALAVSQQVALLQLIHKALASGNSEVWEPTRRGDAPRVVSAAHCIQLAAPCR
jgi:hypothetical protein